LATGPLGNGSLEYQTAGWLSRVKNRKHLFRLQFDQYPNIADTIRLSFNAPEDLAIDLLVLGHVNSQHPHGPVKSGNQVRGHGKQ